jgi:hypothetical protein
MNKETGGSAFPMPMTMMTAEHVVNEPEFGMTLRDYFAAKAMHGILTDPRSDVAGNYEATAEFAYRIADAMLKAREA